MKRDDDFRMSETAPLDGCLIAVGFLVCGLAVAAMILWMT